MKSDLNLTQGMWPLALNCLIIRWPAALFLFVLQIGASMEVDEKVRQLRERVAVEVRTQGTLLELQGALEPVLATSADVSDESVPQIEAASTALLQ